MILTACLFAIVAFGLTCMWENRQSRKAEQRAAVAKYLEGIK